VTTEGFATLSDTVTDVSVDFMMSPDFEPAIHEVGAIFWPLNYPYAIKSTDGARQTGPGIFTITSTSDDMDYTVQELLQSDNVLLLTLPTGDTYYFVIDPQTDRKGKAQFSYMLWQFINIWTIYTAPVAAP
jgi:hypothetical protein